MLCMDTVILRTPEDDVAALPKWHFSVQLQERVNVAVMMTSGRDGDVFGERDMFLKSRRKLEEQKRKAASKASPLQVHPRPASLHMRLYDLAFPATSPCC